MLKTKIWIVAVALSVAGSACAQKDAEQGPFDNMHYTVEMQSTLSEGKTPLWLNANRYGLSSLSGTNGYLRASLAHPIDTDADHKWGIGWCADVAVPYNFTSDFVVQQAYVEGRWLKGMLTVGSKEWPMELKNNELSSGSQTLGRNARPVPQVRISLPEYWDVPYTRGWVGLKGHIAYGRMTDDNWQHDFTGKRLKYADDVLYHTKAGYLKIGNEHRFFPFSLELGLEMASTFGGTAHRPDGKGGMETVSNGSGLKAYWQAFIPGGAEATETTYQNIEGNQLGSWLIRLNYKADRWALGFYVDKYFEDQSAMFQLDYDGYGSGDEWNEKKKSRFFLYDFKDMMLGLELNMEYEYWIQNVVLEYIYTKYQSGPVYHDHTLSISDHIGGNDDFCNHGVFTGWQHWGQVMGNPLYLSPIYNENGEIRVANNRFHAVHLGISSTIHNLHYRVLATYQDGLGTYSVPYTRKKGSWSVMAEAGYSFDGRMKGWAVGGACGADWGSLRGNNYGFQLTISKTGIY